MAESQEGKILSNWGVWTPDDSAPTSDQRHFFDMLHPEENLNLFGFSTSSPPDASKSYPSDNVDPPQMPTGKRSYEEVDDAWEGEQANKVSASGKGDVAAARAKANREKQRREKLNGRFAELAALIEPGKVPKTDRNIILEDAVRVIQQLRVENNQIKQLNKFLEEKVQDNERNAGHALYRHAMAAQAALPAMNPASGASSSMMPMMQSAPTAATPAAGGLTPTMMMQMFNFMQLMQNAQGGTASTSATAPSPPDASAFNPAAMAQMFAAQAQHQAPFQQTAQLAPTAPMPERSPSIGQATSSQSRPEDQSQQFDAKAGGAQRQQVQGPGGVHEGAPTAPSQQKQELYTVSQQISNASAPLDTQMKLVFPQMNMPANFTFPPVGGTPSGWPPANMLDMTMDSQLRPPAA